MTSNLPAVILIASLVSCHTAPAMALPLASPPVAGYAGDAGPHGQSGLASGYHRRTTAQAVFLCVSYSAACVMAGCMGHPSGWPVPMTGRPTLYSPPPCRLASAGGGEVPIIGVTTMTTPARIPSAARQRSVKITALILLSLKTGAKTGTIELQQRITREGIPVTLRTVQRRLAELSTILPIEGDGASPQGWRWKADTAATVASVAGGAA
jgi:hypothetical protein